MSKIEKVEETLNRRKYIINKNCVLKEGIWRLSDIIYVLKKRGYKILTVEPESSKKYDCRYYLADTDNNPIRKIPKGYKITFSNYERN